LQDFNATNEAKSKAAAGLIASGIHPSVVKSWALQGVKSGAVDPDTKIRRLKWVISTKSGTTADQKRRAVTELLENGIRSEIISSWAKQ